MEKRIEVPVPQPLPVPAPVQKNETLEMAVEALVVSHEVQAKTADLLISLDKRIASDGEANVAALSAIAEAVKPKAKVIDVKVTGFNENGRPTGYRIIVN